MIKKCVHLADIHLRTFERHAEYKEAFNTLFSELTLLLSEYKREETRIVIAGDIVHQKLTISNELTLMVAWLFKSLEKIAPLIIIAGNHDALLTNNNRLDSITPIVSLMKDLEISYFKKSECYQDDNIVWCVYSVFENNKRPEIEKARKLFGENKTYIGLFHGPLIGLKTDLGFNVEHGDEISIFEGCDMVMCGDIHIRGGFDYYQKTEIYEENLEEYLKLGWEIDKS